MKKILEQLEEMTKRELEQITKQTTLSGADLDKMIKATCLLDQMESLEEKLEAKKNGEFYGMSYGNMNHMGVDGYGNVSYERGRSSVTGRYVSRDTDPMMHGGHGSYDRGYSGHSISDRMVSSLEKMYDEAKSPHEQQVISTWISRIRNEA